ncbi:MAG: chemotaxis protein CheW [Magnetococcales bacterium]|nr:chemotaxis protein CheW [Magnetococcales bacterium]
MDAFSFQTTSVWPYLVFQLGDKHYGLKAEVVRQIVRLPEIAPLEELPHHVAGLVNVRGRLVPVVDLDARTGAAERSWSVSDFLIIIILHDEVDVAVMANHIVGILDLQPRQSKELRLLLGDEEGNGMRHGFLSGVASMDNQVVALLDHHTLLSPLDRQTMTAIGGMDELELRTRGQAAHPRRFSPGSSEREHSVFRERARRLTHPLRATDTTLVQAFAIVQLHETRLALAMETVRGFVTTTQMTPIPCCPGHIAGIMSRRGEMVTLLDVSRLLAIPISATPMGKAVLVEVHEDEILGFLVHQVVEVVYQDAETRFLPGVQDGGPDHWLGSLRWQGDVLSVIHPARLLSSPELVVDQTP